MAVHISSVFREVFYIIPSNYDKQNLFFVSETIIAISNTFGPLIPNPASVFVLYIRILHCCQVHNKLFFTFRKKSKLQIYTEITYAIAISGNVLVSKILCHGSPTFLISVFSRIYPRIFSNTSKLNFQINL